MSLDFYLNQRTGEGAFAFYAMWTMGFGAFVLSLVIGLGIGLIKRPRSLNGRFLVAATVVLLLYAGAAFVGE